MRTLTFLLLLSCFCSAQAAFPQWRGSNTLEEGLWAQSQIVAIGDVVNVSSYGEETVRNLPWPMAADVRRLYWCQGDFRTVAVVKGQFHSSGRKYLWASPLEGCKLWDDNPALASHRFKTRVWFLREEGSFLRPTFDGGTRWFIGLFTAWDDHSTGPARQRLGVLLLTPGANSDSLKDYADYLWHVGNIACELLGKQECASHVRVLARAGDPSLKEMACEFLAAELREKCGEK